MNETETHASSSHREATSSLEPQSAQPVSPAQAVPPVQPQADVISQLLTTLLAINKHFSILLTTKRLKPQLQFQFRSVLSTIEPLNQEPEHGATHDLSSLHQPASVSEEPMFTTATEAEAMLKREKKKASTTSTWDLNPPSSGVVAPKPYLPNTRCQSFRSLEGTKHQWACSSLPRFHKPLSPRMELCFSKFSKSLTDRAYTWYINLKPRTIHDWEHMVSTFNTKFFYAEAKFTSAELGQTRHYADDLDLYVRWFHEKGARLCDPVDEEVLVNVYLHVMVNEYLVHLDNLSFPSFSRLMEATERTNKSVRRTSMMNSAGYFNCFSSAIRPLPPPRKRPTIMAVGKG